MAAKTVNVKDYLWSASTADSPIFYNLTSPLPQIRPCHMYKEEYEDCTSIKGRFHQYFIFGQSTNCDQWKVDYDNCVRFQSSQDEKSGVELVTSERERRNERMQAHYGNDTWTKRDGPPADWSSPLPDWLEKENENSYLAIKSKEMRGEVLADKSVTSDASFCSIM
jgi:Protein of unknown function (DUF3128)